jgi:glucokinase
VAISFAFPGPADYPAGIIGNTPNLVAFRGGVALGPMLRERFGLPVFLNNDGDLFAYGEAISGFLPYVNERLRAGGSAKQYRNLFGITLGTGFGGGIVRNGELFLGDNSSAAEIWVMRNKLHNACFVEEGASIRAVQRVYLAHSQVHHATEPTPKEIYEYACGSAPGDRPAAIAAFQEMGEVVGDALANAITLIDGLVVIGGGLSAASSIYLPRLIEEMNGSLETLGGDRVDRMEIKAFNLEDETQFAAFIRGQPREIAVPGTAQKVVYDPLKRIGVGLSRLGTSRAVALGAYAFALHNLDQGNGPG